MADFQYTNFYFLSNISARFELSLNGTVYGRANCSSLSSITGGYFDPDKTDGSGNEYTYENIIEGYKLTAQSVSGFDFKGWYTRNRNYSSEIPVPNIRDADTLLTASTSITVSEILSAARWWGSNGMPIIFAIYEGKEIICTYNPNGGFCDRYFDRVRAAGVFPSLPTATWDSDTTSRWYTLPTGGTEIHQGDTVTQTEDFTLYAHWDRTETCTVTFNAGEGIASETQRTVNKGAAIGALPTATWTGHTFKGWFLSSGGGTAITAAYVVDDDLYLYAQWDSNTYTVTFNGNGGTPSQSTKSVAYGSQYGTLPYCDQTGKTFLGWFTSATGGTKVEATTIFNQQSNQVLYAHWSDVNPAVKWYYLVSP